MPDVDTVFDKLLEEFESGVGPSIEKYVLRYPEHRDDLLDLWVILTVTPPPTDEELAEAVEVTERRLHRVEQESIRDLLLAASLGPAMLDRLGEEHDNEAAEIGAELERIRAVPYTFRGSAPLTFRRIAVYAWIAGVLLTKKAGPGVSRLRVQKVAYLLEHGLSLGVFQKHAKYRYGPYDPSLTYRDAEPGCLKAKYLTKGGDDLLRPGPKLTKAMDYARRYLREESVARAFVVHLSSLDQWTLETLTTVHALVAELGPNADARAVARALKADAKWGSKLRRGNFTIEMIEDALRILALLRMTEEQGQ